MTPAHRDDPQSADPVDDIFFDEADGPLFYLLPQAVRDRLAAHFLPSRDEADHLVEMMAA